MMSRYWPYINSVRITVDQWQHVHELVGCEAGGVQELVRPAQSDVPNEDCAVFSYTPCDRRRLHALGTLPILVLGGELAMEGGRPRRVAESSMPSSCTSANAWNVSNAAAARTRLAGGVARVPEAACQPVTEIGGLVRQSTVGRSRGLAVQEGMQDFVDGRMDSIEVDPRIGTMRAGGSGVHAESSR
ncbi:hypothetical protein OH767_49945 [Streptomyces sp. NBC_01614]